MIIGTILLGLAALMLYQGFTGNSAVGEIQKLLAGEAAFSSQGTKLRDTASAPELPPVGESPLIDDILGRGPTAPELEVTDPEPVEDLRRVGPR